MTSKPQTTSRPCNGLRVLALLTVAAIQSLPSPAVAQESSAGGLPPLPWIGVFAAELPRASEWAALPLQIPVPVLIRDTVVSLDEGLNAEAFKSPQAAKQAYVSAHLICRVLLTALDDRESTMRQNRQTSGGNLSPSWTNAWEDRSAAYRNTIRTEYTRFSDAVIKSEQPKLPPEAGAMGSVSFPPAPDPTQPQGGPKRKKGPKAAPKPDENANQTAGTGGNGGLNRAAYDHHYIWRSWWGTYR